ncbi:unnamed protein product [Thlaspi arvense]|uniref:SPOROCYTELESS-like EAR-containing protein 1 n=1 Tax=Thlaspi arvense TaxID=13288 RepID=A0AAU9SC42_THLAR|nr:unnamed protein product [Thlaspi arvense]
MCSNTSSGSYGGDLQDEYFGSCPKKQKKDRVRRRGPGVAELEKIRLELEQENKSPSLPIPHSSSSSSSLPKIDHTLFAHPPPEKTSFYTANPIFRPPATVSVTGGCDYVMMPPDFALPLSSYFSNGSFPKDLIPPAPVFQRKQHSLHHPTTMNLPNPSPGPGGFYQFIEQPSNQRSCVDNFSPFPEEEKKMVSAKRPWHFLTDTTTRESVGPAITISREAKQNRSLDMRLITPVQDSGTTICNPIAIDSPTSIRHDHPRFIPLQNEQHQQSKKPFYSFMPSDDRSNGDREQRACDRYESAADLGIDLSLKL